MNLYEERKPGDNFTKRKWRTEELYIIIESLETTD